MMPSHAGERGWVRTPTNMLRFLIGLTVISCSTNYVAPPPTDAEICRTDAEGRIKAACRNDMWRDHSPTEADVNDIVNACLNPNCLASSSTVVPCSSSCTKAKLSLLACSNGSYSCDFDTELPIIHYPCADYDKRQAVYNRDCL
jgi:hypothetical protein